MRKPVCTFDEANHEYRIDGRIVPSVTQVMPVGFFAGDQEANFAKGRENHARAALGEFDSYTIMNPITLKTKTYRQFFGKSILREKPLFSKRLGFAGTPDEVTHDGKCGWVIDVKHQLPGNVKPVTVQTAAYRILAKEARIRGAAKMRLAVVAFNHERKTFAFKELYDAKKGEEIFLALLKRRHLDRLIESWFFS